MQFNQPYFGTGFNNGVPFIPLNTSFPTQCVQSPEVVGEGEIVSLVLPDGSVQLFFLPTNKWCAPFITIPNKTSCWFVKSVANPVPHPTYFQNQLPGGIPCPRLTLGYSGSFEVPNPFKFHSDGATSTTDIHYFYPRFNKFSNASKLCTGVQVVIPGQSSSCQSEGVSCIPSNCGQHNCNCCNRKCDNKGAFNREISSQGDTKKHHREDFICKCYAETKVKRSLQNQNCMSVDEDSIRHERKREKKHHSQPKKKRSTHSQTSMSIDESRSEIRTSRSKKQIRGIKRKTNECRKVRSKRKASNECSCISIRKRKRQRKIHTRKKKKMSRSSNTDISRCKCSDSSLSSSKSIRKHITRDQHFDNKISNINSNSVISELECQFCESCLSSFDLKMNLRQKNKSSTKVTCKCYSSSGFSSSVSQTDTSHGMSVDQEIKGNIKYPPKSDVEKKNQENTATRDGMILDQEIKHHKNKTDNTNVTCVCIYPASDESQVKDTPPESNKPLQPLDKNISNHSSKPRNLLDKKAQLRPNTSSNTGPIYKADADFCECFSHLIQPPTRDKTFKQIEKDLKRLEKTNSSKIRIKKKPVASRKRAETSDLVGIGTQDRKVVENNEGPIDIQNKNNIDFRPDVDFNSFKEQSSEMGKQLCGTFEEVCYCETPELNTSDVVYSAYFSHSSIVDSNILFPYDRTTPMQYRTSCILDSVKYTPSIPKSNSV